MCPPNFLEKMHSFKHIQKSAKLYIKVRNYWTFLLISSRPLCHLSYRASVTQHCLASTINFKLFYYFRCPYAASTRSTLQRHISVIHDKERPYRCDLCPSATFGQKVSFNITLVASADLRATIRVQIPHHLQTPPSIFVPMCVTRFL